MSEFSEEEIEIILEMALFVPSFREALGLRDREGLSMGQLARLLGISRGHVYRIEEAAMRKMKVRLYEQLTIKERKKYGKK